MEREYWS